MEKTEIKKSALRIGEDGLEKKSASRRLEVLKTYKIFIGGQFPRTESGRYYVPVNNRGKKLANVCLSSRKDFRDAVAAARAAFPGWSGRAAFNRGQILYRMAEMLEGRKAQFIEELMQQDASRKKAEREVNLSVDRLIYYAGWCDKYQQLFSAVNPVASSHFNFSVPEPTGVVSIIAPQQDSLLGLVSVIAAAITGGNTCVVLASETKPLCSITFAEVLGTSDLPAGVVNMLTGKLTELSPWFVDHMDVNATVFCEADPETQQRMRERSALNLKRICFYDRIDWYSNAGQSPYFIMDLQEIKTTWHPIEEIAGSGSGY
ncbi:MAG TPA: aldehyde dehydrogenase family protein [Chitinophagaceae bacterium]|nr:aldehyde dehydrogenase family protein [Chitinophagaceae bacterium]